MLNEAAKDAITGSYFDAIGKLGMAAASWQGARAGSVTKPAEIVEGKWSKV
jgi:hypothetical protein